MNIASFAPLAVVLPILGAALTFLLIRQPRAQRTVSIALLSLTLLLECLLLASVWQGGTAAVNIGGWLPPWGIVLVVDQFSSLMLVVSSTVSLAVLVYATGQGMADGDSDAPVSIFHPTYLILVAGVSNAFLSGDLFNLYVGFEILLTASYVLMTLGGTGPRIRAGVTYVVVSVVSSVLFLIAIEMIFGKRQARKTETAEKAMESEAHHGTINELAIFPLAIPLISGPAAISAIILLSSQAPDTLAYAGLGGVIAIILLSCMGAFLLADKIERLLGETAQLVITRLLGVLLAALSVQFVADGILAFIRT